MSMNGDFSGSPIDIPGLTYTPGFETGVTWATQYSSLSVGSLALSQNTISAFASNFVTRDIAGRTHGICVNPWDFNFVKGRKVDGSLISRPTGYTRTSFTPCDCSYHVCDRDFQGIQYSLDLYKLWFGEAPIKGLVDGISSVGGGAVGVHQVRERLGQLGIPSSILTNMSTSGDPPSWTFDGIITEDEYDDYTDAIANIDTIIQGSPESSLLTFALIKFIGSVTGGVFVKNNIMSALAFAQDTLEISVTDYGNDFQEGGGDFSAVSSDIIHNYARRAQIPGFTASAIYTVAPGLEDIRERCMCVEAGMHGLDAMPFADNDLVIDQLTEVGGIGGMNRFIEHFDFDGSAFDLASFLTIDGQYLKNLGVTGAMPYRYGPNWAYGSGFGQLNVIALAVPEYKNWEVRDSGKIRMSGTVNGEPYSFGGQWLEWGQRIGVPPIEAVEVSPKTINGGDFTDANFGFKGSLEGSLIYRGKLDQDTLPYEAQDYEFAFTGITFGDYGASFFTKYHLGLTTIRHLDGVSNFEAYGETGSIEDIVFSDKFSESPQDKTVYRM